MREIQPHPEEQRSYAELREEFRAEHTSNLRAQMSSHHRGWCVIGDPESSRVHFTASQWARELDKHLCEPVTQDFGLNSVPQAMWEWLEDLASKSLLHDSVTWEDSVEGVVDHDASPCPPVESMTDYEICEYVDRSIKESKRG